MKYLFLSCLTCLCFVTACTPTTATRGNFLYDEDIALIQPQASTQNDVLNILGTPTSKAVFDDKTWYYVGIKTEKESFFDEKVTQRQLYKVTFNDDNIVEDIALVDGTPEDVPLASRITPTTGNEVTFIQQVLGNIGKFNPQTEQ